MAHLTLHAIALDPIINGLKNAHAFISKAYAHTQTAGLDPNTYLSARLHPDMYDFTKQVRYFTKEGILLINRFNPEHKGLEIQDEVTGFPGLLDYIKQATEYLESVEPEILNGKENDEIVLKFRDGTMEVRFTGLEMVTQFAHPNFWFHVTTAYDILRKEGLEIGKNDYINGAGLKKFKLVGEKP